MRQGNGSHSPARSARKAWQECDECDKTTKGTQTIFCCRHFVLLFLFILGILYIFTQTSPKKVFFPLTWNSSSNALLSISFDSSITRLHGVCFRFRGSAGCWCAEMESYEEFCLRSLAFLQEEGKFKKSTCEPLCSLKTQSVILFHGRAILSPLVRKILYRSGFTTYKMYSLFSFSSVYSGPGQRAAF